MKSRIKITMSETKANLLSSMAILITMAIISSIFHTTNAEGPLFECPKGKKINFSISKFIRHKTIKMISFDKILSDGITVIDYLKI